MNEEKKGLNISTKSFITAIAVIFVLMILTYILTFFVPGGEYARVMDANGNLVIDTAAGFTSVEGGIPFLEVDFITDFGPWSRGKRFFDCRYCIFACHRRRF